MSKTLDDAYKVLNWIANNTRPVKINDRETGYKMEQASTQAGKQQTRSSQGYQYTADGGFANTYTSSGYQDPFADDYGSGPALDISSDDLPF